MTLNTKEYSMYKKFPDGEYRVPMGAYKKLESVRPADFVFFYNLVEFISPVDCILRPNGDLNNKPFSSVKEISKAIGRKYGVCYKHIKALCDQEILKVETLTIDGQEGQAFFANPFLLYVSDRILDCTTDLFKDTRWAEWSKKEE